MSLFLLESEVGSRVSKFMIECYAEDVSSVVGRFCKVETSPDSASSSLCCFTAADLVLILRQNNTMKSNRIIVTATGIKKNITVNGIFSYPLIGPNSTASEAFSGNFSSSNS